MSALLDMTGITKTFTGSRALDKAEFQVGAGEVHALVGQNGAGKSTLMKVLTGVYRRDSGPDGGQIVFAGQNVDFSSPQAAQAAGISTIYQEVNLIALRSVTENIFLGREKYRMGLLDWRQMHAEADKLLGDLGLRLDVKKPLGSYNIAIQQMVAIARAVSVQAKLVVMDEPTSSLDDEEVDVLFRVIRQLKAGGISVVFITHHLDELYEVCDRVTILRDGQTVYQGEMASLSKLELVARMIGKNLGEVQAEGQTAFAQRQNKAGAALLQADALRHAPKVKEVNLNVNAGQIVGLAGLLGAGRSETARLLFGADNVQGGTLKFAGLSTPFRTPREAIAAGLGFCPEDRKVDGIIPQMSVRENITLALLPRLAKAGIVDTAEQARIVTKFIDQLGIKTAGPDQPIKELSGGNQQKVLLARWLCMNPKLLILDEPTRGIDVGAKGEIQKLINTLAEEGLGVLMISSELEELVEGCDQVTVMRDGRSVAHLGKGELSAGAIMNAMANAEAGAEAEVAHVG